MDPIYQKIIIHQPGDPWNKANLRQGSLPYHLGYLDVWRRFLIGGFTPFQTGSSPQVG